MHKIFVFVFSKRTLFFLLIVFALAYFVTFINLYIQTDENWFGEESFYLLKDGTVKLKSMPLLLNFHERVYVYYKLFVYAGSGLIWLFGWSLWPLKFFVFALFITFVIVYRNWLKSKLMGFNLHQQLLALFFLITTPVMIRQTFTFRPEVPMMLLGFLSFMFIYKGLTNNSSKLIYIGALFSGLSFLMHLNGNVFMITGFIFILTYKKIKTAFIYSVIAGSISILYFFDLASLSNIQAFMFQLKNWPVNYYQEIDTHTTGFIINRLKDLLSEHQRFFWSNRVCTFSLIFFICLLFGFKEIKQKYPGILRYFLILVLCLNIFGGFIAERYILYYMPVMAFVIAVSIYKLYSAKASNVFSVLLLILMGIHIWAITINLGKVFALNYNHQKAHEQVMFRIPSKSKVLAPWEFIFNGIENYQIYSYKNIEYFKFSAVSTEELVEIADKLSANYIIVSTEFYHLVNTNKESILSQGIPNFTTYYSDEKFLILRRN